MIFINDRYVKFLEGEVTALRKKVEALEGRNQELVLKILEKTSITLTGTPKPPQHQMKKSETDVNCSCGWNYHSEDPIKLQQEISAHFRQFSAPAGRKSWPQQRAAIEAAGEGK